MTSTAFDPADPAWYLDDLSVVEGSARYLRIDRDSLSTPPFLDARLNRQGLLVHAAPLSSLAAPPAKPRVNFIWHTAFCGSTLMAQCLDAPGRNLSLKEPNVLMQLSNARRMDALAPRGLQDSLPRAVFASLGRGFTPGEAVLLKPTNACNNLIADAGAQTDGRMLLLYSGCRDFLISVAKKGEGCRSFARTLFQVFAMDGHAVGQTPERQLFKMSDLQIAALAWHMQVDELRATALKLGPARVRALNADRFFEAPGPVLTRLDRFFELGLGDSGIQAVLDGPLLKRDPKIAGREYDASRRQSDAQDVEAFLGDDLDRIVGWAAALFPDTDPKQPLGPELDL